MENVSVKSNLRDITQIAMMAALTFIATFIIRVPSLAGGYTHIGDSMVFIGVILLGKKKGVISAAVGMFLSDLIGGYLLWSPFTLVIKGVMALIAGSIAFRKNYNGKNMLNNIFAFIISGIWMVIAYLFAGAIIAKINVASAKSLFAGLIVSLKDVPGNIIEVLIGILIAVPIIYLLDKSSFFKKINQE